MSSTPSSRVLSSLSFLGTLFVVVGFGASCFGLLIDLFRGASNPYQGLLTFLLFPSLAGLGLVLLLPPLVVRYLRRRRGEESSAGDRRVRQRRILIAQVGFVALFLMISMVGAFRTYEFTESEEFCGSLCHEPMEPQYTAFQHSPHASVECTACHVGPGVERYLEAKVSGLNQVVQVLGNSYERPIRASRDSILPSNETCERCHWPQKSFGSQLDDRARYGYDLLNTRRPVRLLLRTGGGCSVYGTGRGIHWDMKMNNRISFRAADELFQAIPWVQVERPDGSLVVFRDSASELSEDEMDDLPVHSMDCLDCHSRPAHRFLSPDEAVNRALEKGAIDPSLPSIKKLGVDSLTAGYPSTEAALVGIRGTVETYYRTQFAGAVQSRAESIENAISELQKVYRLSVFPRMKVDWGTYPDNLGHRTFPGCFRCHTGRHLSPDGQVIRRDCGSCHTFLEKEKSSESLIEVPYDRVAYHPFSQSDAHREIECWSCHAAVSSPYASCKSCHAEAVGAHGMSFECSTCHEPGEKEVGGKSCSTCHPTLESRLHSLAGHGECLDCHRPHEWKVEGESACARCHEHVGQVLLSSHYSGTPCATCHSFAGVASHMKGLPVSH